MEIADEEFMTDGSEQADDSVLTDGKVDLGKMKPIMFDGAALCYRTIGDSIGKAWGIGKECMK